MNEKAVKVSACTVAASLMMASLVPAESAAGNTAGEVYKGYFSRDCTARFMSQATDISVLKAYLEAPDYGHESSSEAASYYLWLEATNG